MIRNSKKGMTMVEAAIVVPMVILSAIAIILIMETLYVQSAESSKFHFTVLDAAGEASECFDIYPECEDNFHIARGIMKVEGTYNKKFLTGDVLKKRKTVSKKDHAYVLNEKRHIRVSDNVGISE